MKKLFVILTVLVASIVTPVQAKNDSINAANVNFKPVYAGKIVHIAKDSSMVITGLDSVVVLAKDSAKHCEKLAMYAGGKIKLIQWVKADNKIKADPKAKGKFQITVTGGDATSNVLWIGFGFILLITLVIGGSFLCVYLELRSK